MAKETGFQGLFQKLASDPTNVLLNAEQIDALVKKLHGTQIADALPDWAKGWRGRLFLQMGGGAPTFHLIAKISSQPKQGRPLAYDAVFTFDGALISENYPFIIKENKLNNAPKPSSNAKEEIFTRAGGALIEKKQSQNISSINNKQRS